MLETSRDAYHRCLFCKLVLPQGELYINHVKEHLTEYRSRSLAEDPPEAEEEDSRTSASRVKVRKFRKRRKKRRETERDGVRSGGGGGDDFSAIQRYSDDLSAVGHRYSDDCLGDSELSDSETEADRREQVAKERRELRTVLARTRLSLAEKQLETRDSSEDLVCLTCLKRFSNIQNLRRHLRLHISRDSNVPDVDSDADTELKFACDFCPEKFANKSAFLVHDKTHQDKPPQCYVCNKKYADRYSLRYHLRTHGIGHQIRCELCNKSFPKPSRLQAHINTFHKNIRNFSCSKCDKCFKTRLHLENHVLLHTGERPHRCAECGEQFRHKVSLVAHQRIHGDVRPYVCEQCGKSFREPSTMKAHMRVHSGDKPYKCNICEKAFTQRAGLNYHKTVHAGLKPYRCGKCDYATAKQSSLRNHEKTIHKTDPSGLNLTSTAGVIPPVEAEPTSLTISSSATIPMPSPPLPSPPLQDGDAIQPSAMYQSTSLPSFNILKSYESSVASQGSIMSTSVTETMKNSKEECVMSDRQSPYSQPSLSPPLTPPGGGSAEYTTTYGGNPVYGERHQYHSSYSSSPLNYSSSGSYQPGEQAEYFTHHRHKFSTSDGYSCHLGREAKKSYAHQYDNYYDYSVYYQPPPARPPHHLHNTFDYQ